MKKPKTFKAWAIVDGGLLVAQKWNEQFCIYTRRKDAEESMRRDSSIHPSGERVAAVQIRIGK
jgi:hypothetical protein